MKLFAFTVISLATFFTQCIANGAEPTALPRDVKYVSDLRKPNPKFPEAVDKAFENFAYSPLKGQGKTLSVNSLDRMNRVYIGKYGEAFKDGRIAFSMSGFELEGSAKLGEIYHAGDGYVVHFKDAKAVNVAVFFKGFQLDRIEKVRDAITAQMNGKSTAGFGDATPGKLQLFNMVFGQAYAMDSCDSYFGSTPGANLSASGFKKLWECTKGFGGGIWDSTGGAAVSLAKGAYNVVVHPVDTFNNAAAEFEKFKAIMSDIEGAYDEFEADFKALPEEVKIKIGCEIVGSVGTSTLIAYFSVGGGSPLLLRSIAQATAKVARNLALKNVGAAQKVSVLADKMDIKARLKWAKSRTSGDVKELAQQKSNLEAHLAKHGDLNTDMDRALGLYDAISNSKDPALLAQFRRRLKDGYIVIASDDELYQTAKMLQKDHPELAEKMVQFQHEQKYQNALRETIALREKELKKMGVTPEEYKQMAKQNAEWERKNKQAQVDKEHAEKLQAEYDKIAGKVAKGAEVGERAAAGALLLPGACTAQASVANKIRDAKAFGTSASPRGSKSGGSSSQSPGVE